MAKIYHFAKFGKLNEKPYGGGEVGNRRTMQMLKELGYDVILIHRYCNYKKKNKWVYLEMILGDLITVLKMFLFLLFKSRKGAVVHISGFTGSYMPIEWLSVLLAKILGYNVTYEIRGGGIVGFYNSGGKMYKWLFHSTIKTADNIWSQGLENKKLISELSSSSFFHYPNCVSSNFMPSQISKKSLEPIKAVYVGRLSPVKNVDVIIDTLYFLRKKGYEMTLDIIGDGVDFPDYVNSLKKQVEKLGLSSVCTFHGTLSKAEMKSLLLPASFFLFPSEEPREGQSNSLTETMSFGIIPIATSQGYNRSTINCDELICDEITAEAYSNRIISVLSGHGIGFYSLKMYNRVKDCFTYGNVKEMVDKEYSRIFKSMALDISSFLIIYIGIGNIVVAGNPC